MEETKRIDIRWLKQSGRLQPYRHGRLTWDCGGEESGSINYFMYPDRMELKFNARGYWDEEWESIHQTIKFLETPCNYGGKRKWFQCSGCYNRVAVLSGLQGRFYCRRCCGLAYSVHSGGHCGHYAMQNGRCRYHGGKSTGARNPVIKHGRYTKVASAERKTINRLIQESRQLMDEIE